MRSTLPKWTRTLVVVALSVAAWRLLGGHARHASARRTIVWGSADDELRSSVLPHIRTADPLVITLISAAVRTQHTTYRDSGPEFFVQILSAMREIDPPARFDIWQTFTRNASSVIEGLSCELLRSNGETWTVPGSYRTPWMYDLDTFQPERKSGMALLLHCPLPGFDPSEHAAADSRLRVRVLLSLIGRPGPFALPEVPLKPYRPPPATEAGLCTAPLFGEFKESNLIDWSVSHRQLGFSPIHWYARDPRVELWVNSVKHIAHGASSDTFKTATPISPETFGTQKLAANGFYADQAIYALDCMLRSTFVGPSKWLGFIDLDEYYIPLSMLPTEEGRKQSAALWFRQFDDEVPSVSLGRTHYVDNSHLSGFVDRSVPNSDGPVPPPRLASVRDIRLPHRDDPPGNHKHAHRVDAVEGTSIHAPTALYPGFTYHAPFVPSSMLLFHAGRTDYTDGPYTTWDRSQAHENWLDAIATEKRRVMRELHHRLPFSSWLLLRTDWFSRGHNHQ